jgi:hypothetical protein
VKYDEHPEALVAMEGLLSLFRSGQIVSAQLERSGIEQHTSSLTAQWDKRFPGFPSEYFPYTSFRGQYHRGRRDAHLRNIIVRTLADTGSAAIVVVNPACSFGIHACHLASRLPHAMIIGTDINTAWNRIYRFLRCYRIPDNCSFAKDDIFSPRLEVQPTAVVFFGACGGVTDAAIDYAIKSRARHLMFRTCCHDNIGGNTVVNKYPGIVNLLFRLKNREYRGIQSKPKYAGYYFSESYSANAYPRSEAGLNVSSSKEFQKIARHSADSDICRAIIDLDRYLYLVEKGYSVVYQGELFVAQRRVQER